MFLRVARHTTNLERVKQFYEQVLGLEFQGAFQDHAGYDGIFLGKIGENWQLEFTCTHDVAAIDRRVDEDDLIVFYPFKKVEYDTILDQINTLKLKQYEPKNPYWKVNGIQIKDPDGNAIIVSKLKVND